MQAVINLVNSFLPGNCRLEILKYFPKTLVQFVSDELLMDYQILLGSKS